MTQRSTHLQREALAVSHFVLRIEILDQRLCLRQLVRRLLCLTAVVVFFVVRSIGGPPRRRRVDEGRVRVQWRQRYAAVQRIVQEGVQKSIVCSGCCKNQMSFARLCWCTVPIGKRSRPTDE